MSKTSKNVLEQVAPVTETAPVKELIVLPVDVARAMLGQNKSTSDIIRALSRICVKTDGIEIDRGAITKALKDAGVRTKNGTEVKYQHVRNTLITPVKKNIS